VYKVSSGNGNAAGVMLLIALSSPIIAAQTTHRVTLNDLQSVKEVRAVELSQTGREIAYSVDGELKMSAIEGGSYPRSLGSGKLPVWSPDGKKLAYYSDKSGTTQLWVYDLVSQRSAETTHVSSGIAPDPSGGSLWADDNWRYSWSPDGFRIVFASQVAAASPGDTPQKRRQQDAGQPLVLNNATPAAWTLSGVFVSAFGQPSVAPGTRNPKIEPPVTSQLFVVDISSGETTQLTHDNRGYFTPDWSPDGRRITCATPSGHAISGFAVDVTSILVLNVESGEVEVVTNTIGNKSMPTWSPDGRKIAFFSGEHGGLKSIAVLDLAEGTTQDLSRQLSMSVGEYRWAADGASIFGIALDGVDWRLVRIGVADGSVHSLDDTAAARRMQLSVASDGSAAWSESDGSHHGVIRLLPRGAIHSSIFLDANPQIRTWELGEQEVVRWKGERGEEMEGILIKPAGYQRGERYPLIVDTYPGVTNRFAYFPMVGNQAWASQGYAIFYPDARAPHVWANQFRTPAFDQMAKGPDGWEVTTEQVLSGVDELIRRGVVDPERMCLYGFSNGGGIVNALVSRTNRFRCAVSVAAVLPDWLAPFFLHTDSYLPNLAVSGDPMLTPGNYIQLSSVFRARKVETPMLLADGDLDQDFLIGSIEWFNALRWSKKEVTFLRYPGQGHGFDGEAMQDFWRRENEFFANSLRRR
jgi:dipeptidyl aminopeptidase/acylaminoacyl peptidase